MSANESLCDHGHAKGECPDDMCVHGKELARVRRAERVTKLHAGAMGDALRDLLASATTRRLSGGEYAIAEAMVAEFERRAKRHA